MDWKPRNRPVFQMPAVSESSENKEVFKEDSPVAVIAAADFTQIGRREPGKLHLIKDLGVSGTSITMLPFTSPSISDENAAASAVCGV